MSFSLFIFFKTTLYTLEKYLIRERAQIRPTVGTKMLLAHAGIDSVRYQAGATRPQSETKNPKKKT